MQFQMFGMQANLIYWSLPLLLLGVLPLLWVWQRRNQTTKDEQKNMDAKHLVNNNHRILEGLNEVNIVAITDAKGVITYVNEPFVKISGYSREELMGKTHRLIRSHYHTDEFYKQMWETILTGRIWQGIIKNRAKNGSLYWVNTSIIPLIDDYGDIEHFLSIRQDITNEMESRERKEEEYLQRLKERNEELEEFAYAASHDLRKPLTTIKGLATLLSDYDHYVDKRDEYTRHISYMHQSADRLLKIVDTLLSQTTYSDHEPLEEVFLKEVIEMVSIDLNIAKRMPELVLNYDAAQTIKAYPTALQRLVQNLIDNSMKYAHPDRILQIDIAVQHSEEEGIHYNRLLFTDNGIGMGEVDKKRCFQVFQRGKNTGLAEGIGIGLATCKKIMDVHKGRISVKSEIGCYTSFIMDFPA